MQSRMRTPIIILPEVSQSLQVLGKALFSSAEKRYSGPYPLPCLPSRQPNQRR